MGRNVIRIYYYVGDKFRFFTLPNGGGIEIMNSLGQWREQERWTQ